MQFADKAQWVGELSGSWHDMGYKIGQECSEMIVASTDYWWGKMCETKGAEDALKEAEYGDESNPNYGEPFDRVMAASIFDCWLWGDPGERKMRECHK